MQEEVLAFEAVSKRYRTGDFWRPLQAQALDGVRNPRCGSAC
jgi:hypothetical protein